MSEIDLRRYIGIFGKWLWLIALCCALAGGVSYQITRSLPPTYLTSTTLVVGEIATDPKVTADQLNTDQRLADAYVDMARRQPILQATVDTLRLGIPWWQLQGQVLATRDGPQMVTIRVVDTNPRRAKAIADEVARQLILQSPTTENERNLEQRRQFVQAQLDSLQANIQQAEQTLAEKQDALNQATGARTVLDLQDQINALNAKIAGWRSTYASLLGAEDVKPANNLTLLEPAFLPTEPNGPNLRANVATAAALGFLLAFGAALLIEYLDDALRTPDQAARALSLPSLGSIASMGRIRRASDVLMPLRKPSSPIAEAYRMLRTNVQLAAGDASALVVLVTSPGLHEGKSTTSANLAISFAQSGKRTILVDADLRHPSLHTLFHLDNCDGLSELLASDTKPHDSQTREPRSVSADVKRRIEACLVPTSIPLLRVLTTGQTPASNSSELLSSPRTELVLTILRGLAEVIILDSPPVLPVADTTILAARGMAVVLVLQAGKTRPQDARLAAQNLRHAQARILGLVLNKAQAATPNYYAYRYPPDAANRDAVEPPQAPLDAAGSSAV